MPRGGRWAWGVGRGELRTSMNASRGRAQSSRPLDASPLWLPTPHAPRLTPASRHFDVSLAHHHRRAADAHGGHCALRLVDLDLEDAWPAHFESLFDHPAERAVLAPVANGEIAAERGARGTGGGIL